MIDSEEGTPQGAPLSPLAERVMESIQGWIEKHLRLQVNATGAGSQEFPGGLASGWNLELATRALKTRSFCVLTSSCHRI